MSALMRIKLLEGAVMPTKGTPGSAGHDLYSPTDILVKKGIITRIDTGVILSNYEPGTYARVAPRSGLALKGIGVLAEVVDSDYRGEIGVVLISHTGDYQIKKHERIAQIIIEQYRDVTFELSDQLDSTLRSDSGFGSTGK